MLPFRCDRRISQGRRSKRKNEKPNVNTFRKSLLNYFNDNEEETMIPVLKNSPSARDKANKLPFMCQLTKTLLESTYMRKLDGRGKQYAAQGNALEEPLAIRMMKELNDGLGGATFKGMDIHEICHTPLASLRNGCSSDLDTFYVFMLKASADFLCYGMFEDGNEFLFGVVEVKAS